MKAIMDVVKSFFEFLLTPLGGIRFFEDKSWWGANFFNFIFITVGFLAVVYWMKQLKKFDDNDEEDKTSTSHTYL